jgi:carbon-monoxide dehydrogenase small subunit
LKDGRAVNACLLLAGQIDGAEIMTIEGLEGPHGIHPLQESFLEHGAVQCGFCTPGMIMSAYELISQVADPSEEQIKEHIAGNLCRCTGYKQIVAAIRAYATKADRD